MENINNFAVLAAAVAQFAIGAVWYSPALFSNKWLAALGKTPQTMQGMNAGHYKAFAASFLGSLLMAYVFAHVVAAFNGTTAAAGLTGGMWMWLGFVVPLLINAFVYDGSVRGGEDRKTLLLINSGYYLVSLVVMGIILALWK